MSTSVAFTIFGIDILWYGLVYSVASLFAYIYFLKYFNDSNLSESQKDVAFIIMLISALVGARLFYTLVYFPEFYLSNLGQILRVDQGGMSAHGSFVGLIIGCYIVGRKYNVPMFKFTDFFMAPGILALAFGRLGNLFNQELPGIPTDSRISMVFPEFDDVKRYPYQLLAGAKTLFVFHIVVYLQLFKSLKLGILTAFTAMMYSSSRFMLDFIREPTTLFLNFPVGQWLSLIMFIISVYYLYKLYYTNIGGDERSFFKSRYEEENIVHKNYNNNKLNKNNTNNYINNKKRNSKKKK